MKSNRSKTDIALPKVFFSESNVQCVCTNDAYELLQIQRSKGNVYKIQRLKRDNIIDILHLWFMFSIKHIFSLFVKLAGKEFLFLKKLLSATVVPLQNIMELKTTQLHSYHTGILI